MSVRARHRLYCQLRLLRLLGALPDAAATQPFERACVARALEIERDLKQARWAGSVGPVLHHKVGGVALQETGCRAWCIAEEQYCCMSPLLLWLFLRLSLLLGTSIAAASTQPSVGGLSAMCCCQGWMNLSEHR